MANSDRPYRNIAVSNNAPASSYGRNVVVALIVAVLIIAAVVIGLMVRGESTSVHTITGHLQLGDYSGSGIASSGPTCHGNGGYSDIGSWTQVKVTNESGKVLGVTSLGEGRGKAVC